jgi:hypothetical protein
VKEPYRPVFSHICQHCGAEFITAAAKSSHEAVCPDNPANK